MLQCPPTPHGTLWSAVVVVVVVGGGGGDGGFYIYSPGRIYTKIPFITIYLVLFCSDSVPFHSHSHSA